MTAIMSAGAGLAEAVSPSPGWLDTASMSVGFRPTGSAVFGRPVANSLGTDML